MGKFTDYLTEAVIGKFTSRFWDKVAIGPDDECWEWTAAVGKSKHDGYGKVALPRCVGSPKIVERSHRVSYYLTFGVDPDDVNLIVRHTCDNPACCNPQHLILGSYQDNMDDMVARKRSRGKIQKGEKNENSVLTAGDVLNIYDRIEAGETNVSIAKTYDVSHSTISAIRRGVSWSHLNR